jgi:hypothetical protein
MSLSTPERALVPCDRVRNRLLRVLAPALAPLLRRRSARASVLASLAVLSAFVFSVWAPALALNLYAVRLRLVPEEDRARDGPRSFRASDRALTRDVGAQLPFLLGLALLALWIYALLDVTRARDIYLRLAPFHGPLELAALTLCFLEGHALEREPGTAHVA